MFSTFEQSANISSFEVG